MAGSNTAPKAARDRILETAAELFYRGGIRAVGVDTIVARSGVAKMSLYRSFPSKDDLVVAFLESRNRRYWDWWDKVMSRHPDSPRDQIRALFAAIAKRTTRPDYRGCPFSNTATEFPEAGHPGREVAVANKKELRRRLRGLTERAGARDPLLLADHLLLLIEGAYTTGQTFGGSGPAKSIEAAAEALVAAQTDRRRQTGRRRAR